MAYSDFTFAKIKQRFGIEQQSIHLFKQANTTLVEPSPFLLHALEFGKTMPLYSEKAKSEALIFPIINTS